MAILKLRCKTLLLLAGCWLVVSAGVAQQNVSALKRQRQRLEQEVALTEKLLRESRESKQQSFNELALLNKKIQLQERIVASITTEVADLGSELNNLDELVNRMTADIKKIQTSYAEVARVTYVHQNRMSLSLWLLSSDSFTEAYRRLTYYRIFSKFRKDQIELIKRSRDQMRTRRAAFEQRRLAKQELLGQQMVQRQKLDRIKTEQRRLYKRLRRKERGYQARLRENQRALEKLKAEITAAIAASSNRNLSAAERDRIYALSRQFSNNKRKLPWPIPMPAAVVTGQFGTQRDASGGTVNNEGVYLATSKGQSIRAIFDGTVTMVSKIPGFGKVVIVQHGNFRSVYANLKNVYVKNGQAVKTLQNLGTVDTERSTGETQLYFQIYKNFTPIDPMNWLAKK